MVGVGDDLDQEVFFNQKKKNPKYLIYGCIHFSVRKKMDQIKHLYYIYRSKCSVIVKNMAMENNVR